MDCPKPATNYDITYLSLGAGVQSTAMLAMSNLGMMGCPRADVAIFSDTGDEPEWVYEQVEVLKAWSDIPVKVVSAGCISEDTIARCNGERSRVAAIPAFTMGSDGRASMLRRQCTSEYKVDPIEREVRALLGYKKGQRIKKKARCMLGISYDEAQRMKPSRTHWVDLTYPLIEARLRRSQCHEIIKAVGLPATKKSSCVFCPFHDNEFWKDMKRNHGAEWDKAVSIDSAIRDMTSSGVKGPVYLHRSLTPLDEIDFSTEQLDLFDGFGNECGGHCGL